MMRISPLRFLLLTALFAGIFLLPGCNGGSEVIADRGGSEVIGKLVTAGEAPVAGADVRVLQITGGDSPDTITVDSTASDENGEFTFKEISQAQYYLFATYNNDSLVLPPYPFTSDSARRVDLGNLVMKEPGAIRGTVLLDIGGPDAEITCYIAGTSFSATTNSTSPVFTVTGIFPTDTSYELTVAAPGYKRMVVSDIPVTGGQVTELPDTIRLVLDPGGAPEVAPSGLTVRYDTLSGVVHLFWNRVRISDVNRYIVAVVSGSAGVMDTVADTIATMNVFNEVSDTVKKTVQFQVAALDNDNNPGPWSPIDSITAVPPSWLRIMTSIGKVAGKGTVDTAYVAMSFTSKIGTVVSWKWWADHPDSIIKEWRGAGISSGSDTIVWATSSKKKRLYVSFTDNRDSVTTDSIDAVSLLPIDVWVTAESLIYARRYAGACVVDGKIYVFGGCQEVRNAAGLITMVGLRYTEMYDPGAGEWSRMSPMNMARFKMASAAVDGKIYVFGGTDGVNDHATVEEYDPATDEWKIVPDTMKQTLVGAAACTVNGKIFLSGGLTGTRDNPQILTAISSYSPQSHQWTNEGNLTVARHLHQSVAVNGGMLIIGGLGMSSDDNEVFPVGTMECAGAVSNCGFSAIGQQGARYGFSAAVVGEKLVLIGGMAGVAVEDVPVNSVRVFVLDGTVSGNDGAAMPAASEGMATVVLDGKIYVIGGSVGGTALQQSSKAVYVYYP